MKIGVWITPSSRLFAAIAIMVVARGDAAENHTYSENLSSIRVTSHDVVPMLKVIGPTETTTDSMQLIIEALFSMDDDYDAYDEADGYYDIDALSYDSDDRVMADRRHVIARSLANLPAIRLRRSKHRKNDRVENDTATAPATAASDEVDSIDDGVTVSSNDVTSSTLLTACGTVEYVELMVAVARDNAADEKDLVKVRRLGKKSDSRSRRKLEQMFRRNGFPPPPSCRSPQDSPPSAQDASGDDGDILEQLDRLEFAIRNGFLPESVVSKLMSGKIAPEWIRANLSRNRDFVMLQLPVNIRRLVASGLVPEEVEAAIFSGKNRAEVARVMASNDDFIKMLLPKRMVSALGDKPIPAKIRELIVSGKNRSEIQRAMFGDDQLRSIMLPDNLKTALAMGFLPNSTLEMLMRGQITQQWIRANLTRNRAFVMTQLPVPIRELIVAGKVPREVEQAIFSGSNRSEITRVMSSNDEFVKLLLPDSLVTALGNKPVPSSLKRLILSGKNKTEMMRAMIAIGELRTLLMESPEMKRLDEAIDGGHLPPDTKRKLVRGKISAEWIRANLTANKDFVMEQLPPVMQALHSDGKLPQEIVDALVSGKNQSEIRDVIMGSDEFFLMLFPEKLAQAIGDRPIPYKVKAIFLSGMNESEKKATILNDPELMEQLIGPSSYFFYVLYEEEQNKQMSAAISILVIVCLTCVMMSLGCTMTIPEIMKHARRPKGVLIALFAQFVVMPASAFGLSIAFDIEMYGAIAVLICGCCPGGNLSNILAYALDGDMNLSILMTTCSSVLGLGMMPLNIWIYSRFIIPMDAGSVIPFGKIVTNIALTILPVSIGIAIRHFRAHWVDRVIRGGFVLLIMCSITIAVLAGVLFKDAFFRFFPIEILGACVLLPLAGYLLGYTLSWVFREPPKTCRTIMVETGCQNVQLCTSVLRIAFDPVLVGVMFLMPMIYMMFQVFEAMMIIFMFRMISAMRNRGKIIVNASSDSDDEKKRNSILTAPSSTEDESSESIEKDDQIGDLPDRITLLADGKENGNATNGRTMNAANKSDSPVEMEEIWPFKGRPTSSCLDSFKQAGSENFV